uniref:Cuticlin-1 n=1 Tax=Ascaris suum TaxID=6253 RepID=F1L337_ASCSU
MFGAPISHHPLTDTAHIIVCRLKKNMMGHVYVKGLYDDDACRNDEGGRQVAAISLPFGSCNVARTRSLNPRGISISTTVVISFHPLFVTKVDRAYRIQCFYMEADKTVDTQIEVSEITTALRSEVIPMPLCRYEILNEEGCALDKYLLNNLEYPADLMAGQEAHVYKYADRSQLFYQCQIKITIKEPGADCERPKCSDPQGFGAVKGHAEKPSRKQATQRLLKKRAADYDDTMDVRTDISAFDIIDQPMLNASKDRVLLYSGINSRICISSIEVSALIGIAVLIVVFGLIFLLSVYKCKV